jgi:hypothetical protein
MLTDSEDEIIYSAGGSDPDCEHASDISDSDGDAGSKELQVSSSDDDSSHGELNGRNGYSSCCSKQAYTLVKHR